MKRLRKSEEKKILIGPVKSGLQKEVLLFTYLVKLCSKKRKEDTAKIDCLNFVPIHPAFFQTQFYSCQMAISLNQTFLIV